MVERNCLVVCLCVFAVVAANTVIEKTVYVNLGGTAILPCRNETPGSFYGVVWKSTAYPDVSSIYDYIWDTGLNIDDRIATRSTLVKDTSLQLSRVEISDSGLYDCHLIYTAPAGGIKAILKSKITLVVSVAPNVTSLTPVSQFKGDGEKAYLTCVTTGVPSVNITWKRRDGKPVRGKITTIGFTSVLKIRRLESSDTGYYHCVAENRAGKSEKSAFLKVKAPPSITIRTPKPHINVDADGKITCRAVGFPIPTVEWELEITGGTKLILSSGQKHEKKFIVTTTDVDKVKESAESSLFINDVTTSDWRTNYTCIAANSEGSVFTIVKVTGFNKPGEPLITKVITFVDKAIVHWKGPLTDGGSKILAYVVQYKNGTQKQWKSLEIRPANVDRFQIMDLKPNTRYNFRIYAKNAVGMSPFSGVYTTSTNEVLRPPTTKPLKGKPTEKTDTPKSSSQKDKTGIFGSFGITALIGIFAGVFLVLVIVIVVVCCMFRKIQKTSHSQTASIPGSRPISMENGSLAPPDSRRPSAMPSETSEMIPLMTRADQWEFPRDRLRLSTVLGTGAFGMVMRGDAQGIRGSIGRVKCAVKMVKDSENECARKDLYAELDMLKLLPEHPNVVSLLGCCTRSEPLMIIVEYCANGDLQGFLRSSRGITERYYRTTYGGTVPLKVTAKTLLTFAWQIATGMMHLASFKVIHRDLAARNVLVDESLICKISDFGFARDVYVEDQYLKKSQGGRFPIKWMALESLLDCISTSKSDVWSFGVVLWEIVTLGASPYPGMNSYEVVSFLQDGYRMDKPKHCSEEVYSVLMDCWNQSPQRRPTFEELADRLKQMVECDDKEFINMNFYQDHLYENFDVNLASQSTSVSAQELTITDSTPLAVGYSP